MAEDKRVLPHLPIGNIVKVKVSQQKESTTKGGIIIPHNKALEASIEGEIMALGSLAFDYLDNDAKDMPHVGDIVLMKKYSGVESGEITDTEVEYRLVRDEDIIEILECRSKNLGEEGVK